MAVGSWQPALVMAPSIETLRQALRGLGYIAPICGGDYERLLVLTAELVQLRVDIVAAEGTPPSRVAKRTPTTIPVVVTMPGDPVATGLVANLAPPWRQLQRSRAWDAGA